MARRGVRFQKLPQLLDRKIYKTGQTRGADDDEIFQNRVSRTSTVLIPYSIWELASSPPPGEEFTYGSVTLISPDSYFGTNNIASEFRNRGLVLGQNALVFYETREQWRSYNPEGRWEVAQQRVAPLGGEYVARISAITASEGEKINRGFNTTANKGVGIRAYEYAGADTIRDCRLQLEALFWLCHDAEQVTIANGMTTDAASTRMQKMLAECEERGLFDIKRLVDVRTLNAARRTVCPLCLQELSGVGFFNRLKQAEGREVSDLTVTQLNLFHIKELRYGAYNHRPYNLGWGHHHCNVVVKDTGIAEALEWMQSVIAANTASGHLVPKKRGN